MVKDTFILNRQGLYCQPFLAQQFYAHDVVGLYIEMRRRQFIHGRHHSYAGKLGAKYTRARRPVELLYSENCQDRSDACKREAAIKKLSRQQKLSLIKSGSSGDPI